MKTMRKLLWKLFPNTMYEVWRDAHETGVRHGSESRMALVERDLRIHDVSDFNKPALTLGYRHAVKAIRGELSEVV